MRKFSYKLITTNPVRAQVIYNGRVKYTICPKIEGGLFSDDFLDLVEIGAAKHPADILRLEVYFKNIRLLDPSDTLHL
jgi:hypothetical protein